MPKLFYPHHLLSLMISHFHWHHHIPGTHYPAENNGWISCYICSQFSLVKLIKRTDHTCHLQSFSGSSDLLQQSSIKLRVATWSLHVLLAPSSPLSFSHPQLFAVPQTHHMLLHVPFCTSFFLNLGRLSASPPLLLLVLTPPSKWSVSSGKPILCMATPMGF